MFSYERETICLQDMSFPEIDMTLLHLHTWTCKIVLYGLNTWDKLIKAKTFCLWDRQKMIFRWNKTSTHCYSRTWIFEDESMKNISILLRIKPFICKVWSETTISEHKIYLCENKTFHFWDMQKGFLAEPTLFEVLKYVKLFSWEKIVFCCQKSLSFVKCAPKYFL